MALKQTKQSFNALVQQATDGESVLSLKHVQSCSKKARQYMLLYRAVQSMKDKDGTCVTKYSILEDSIKLYRNLIKKT